MGLYQKVFFENVNKLEGDRGQSLFQIDNFLKLRKVFENSLQNSRPPQDHYHGKPSNKADDQMQYSCSCAAPTSPW